SMLPPIAPQALAVLDVPPDLVWPVRLLTFFVGACIGSFLNVCISRWPDGLSVVRPRSRCPNCAHEIRWFENLPVASWLALRGRCSGCAQPISWMYPAVELVVACGWLAAVIVYGPSLEALRIAVFGTLLFGIAMTDARHYLIPDGFTVFGLAWVLVAAFTGAMLGASSQFAGPLSAFIGACVGTGAIRIVGWLGEVALKKEAMGFGDETLMAVVGAALGAERALLTILLGAFLGAVGFALVVGPIAWVRARRAGTEFAFPDVPFGVFLAPAAMVALLWGDRAIQWYFSLAGIA
ncbi:MAG: prepilin peptidase, partial [Gemmatimonadaceae bacterium]|nr:prepilin peptidase [Gemmatimonadaceae bacterium]